MVRINNFAKRHKGKLVSFITFIVNLSAIVSVYYAYQTVRISKEAGRPYLSAILKRNKLSSKETGYVFKIINLGDRAAISPAGRLFKVDTSSKNIIKSERWSTGNDIIPNEPLEMSITMLNGKESRYSTTLALIIKYNDILDINKKYTQKIIFKIPDHNGGKKIHLAYDDDYTATLNILKDISF